MQAESRTIAAGELSPPKSEPSAKVGGSLSIIVAVLRASRYLFAYNGLLFVVFQSVDIRRTGQSVTVESIFEIAMLGLLGPALVWVSTKWGERLAHHVEELQNEIVAANQTAQEQIQRRKRVDVALRDMEGQYRALVEHANDFIVLLQNGTAVYRNPALAELIGYTADETRDRSFLDFIATEDHAIVSENYRRRLAGEEVPDTYEVTLIGRRGERVTVEVTPSIIEHRGFPATMVVMHDITQRKAAEVALQASEHRLASILDISADAIISMDESQRVFVFNRGAEKMFGYAANEIVGQSLDTLLPTMLAYIQPRQTEGHSASPATANSMSVRDVRIKGVRKDGSEFPAEASISEGLSGDEWISTVYLRDITEQESAKAALKQSKEAQQLAATHQAVLADIGRVVTSSLDMDEVYDRLVERVRWLLESDRVVISIIQPGLNAMTNAHVAGVDLPGLGRGHTTPASSDSVAWEAVRKKSYVLVQSDLEEEIERGYPTLRLGFEAGIRSFLTVPLISKDAAVGVLHLGSTRVDAYGERELALAESVAAQIAGTIANTELYNAAQRHAEEMNALAQVGRVVSSSLDIDDVFKQSVQLLARLIPCDRIAIATVNHQARAIKHVYVEGVEVAGWAVGDPISFDEAAMGDGLETHRAQLIDPERETLSDHALQAEARARAAGLRSRITVPLVSNGITIGGMNLRSKTPDAYSQEDVALAEQIGTLIAQSLSNAQLYTSVQDQAAERQTLAAVGRIISSSVRVDDVFDRFAEEASKLIAFDKIVIRLAKHGDGSLAETFASGTSNGGQGESRDTGALDPHELWGLETVVMASSDDPMDLIQRFPRLQPLVESGLRSFLRVRLVAQNEDIGFLAFGSRSSRGFTERDQEVAERIAAQIAGAVANTRLYATVQRDALEKEALAEIGRVISSSLDIDEIFESFAQLVRRLIPYDRLTINLVDLEHDTIVAAHIKAFLEVRGDGPGDISPLAGSIVEETSRTREPSILHHCAGDGLPDRFPGLRNHIDAGLQSFLTVPLVSRNDVIGSFALSSALLSAFSDRDVSLAQQIAAQIAGAVASSELYREQERSEEALKQGAAELERYNEELAYEVAERTRAERALIQYSHDLAKSNGELEQFAYVASHDLQEPLRMVSSYTQLLARRYRGQLDSDADDFISFAVDGVQRMQKLIEDLLEYSRVGSRGDAPEPTNLEEVLDEALANLTAAIEESGAEVTRDPLPTLSVDASQLTQLFQNLIGNALKFRREAPQVHISAVTKEDLVTVSVRDNGIGIQSDYIERVFAIFQRLHTRDEYAGTGIGLAVCRRIVERHNGRIWAESEPGVGTTFYFAIPTNGHAEKRQRDEVGE